MSVGTEFYPELTKDIWDILESDDFIASQGSHHTPVDLAAARERAEGELDSWLGALRRDCGAGLPGPLAMALARLCGDARRLCGLSFLSVDAFDGAPLLVLLAPAAWLEDPGVLQTPSECVVGCTRLGGARRAVAEAVCAAFGYSLHRFGRAEPRMGVCVLLDRGGEEASGSIMLTPFFALDLFMYRVATQKFEDLNATHVPGFREYARMCAADAGELEAYLPAFRGAEAYDAVRALCERRTREPGPHGAALPPRFESYLVGVTLKLHAQLALERIRPRMVMVDRERLRRYCEVAGVPPSVKAVVTYAHQAAALHDPIPEIFEIRIKKF